VYGDLNQIPVVETATRYQFVDRLYGINEIQPVDFQSPYGCSKGTADQYTQDYARIYNIPTVVFRMSCIYGPRQFGNEDQGWLAHFTIATQNGYPITIYGDGKQVRDLLYIKDLVWAFHLAVECIDKTAGCVYNIGGGPGNTLSVWAELNPVLEELRGDSISVRYGEWRQQDQRCYVSDIRRAADEFGWRPKVDCQTGIERLWKWVSDHREYLSPERVDWAGK
jgi:CDP-paratose 2-epimerase